MLSMKITCKQKKKKTKNKIHIQIYIYIYIGTFGKNFSILNKITRIWYKNNYKNTVNIKIFVKKIVLFHFETDFVSTVFSMKQFQTEFALR